MKGEKLPERLRQFQSNFNEFLRGDISILALNEAILVGKQCEASNMYGRCHGPVYSRKNRYCHWCQSIFDGKSTSELFMGEIKFKSKPKELLKYPLKKEVKKVARKRSKSKGKKRSSKSRAA